jgi:pimeloyl-ACP methyl ester carboxylesterase
VLLVPGLGGIGSYWSPNIPAFSQKHCVVIHDHRGMGQSSRSRIRYSVDQMTADLLAVMDDLGIEKAPLTKAGAAAYVRSATVFLYPNWWINRYVAACTMSTLHAVFAHAVRLGQIDNNPTTGVPSFLAELLDRALTFPMLRVDRDFTHWKAQQPVRNMPVFPSNGL